MRNLSDGVFAIVLTLLVLNLNIPGLADIDSNAELARELLHRTPILVGYLVSFVAVGMYWMVHTRIVRRIIHPSRKLLSRNLVFLFWLSLVPFTTTLSTGTQGVPLAWAIYSANMVMLGISVVAIWSKAVVMRCVDSHVTPLYGRYIALRGWTVVAVFATSVPLAFLNIRIAQASLLAIPLAAYFIRRHLRPHLVVEFAHLQETDAASGPIPL